VDRAPITLAHRALAPPPAASAEAPVRCAYGAGMGRRTAALVPFVAIAVIAAQLRPALSSVAPLVTTIQARLHLSSPVAGLLTTLPIICFALFSPVAPRLARRYGMRASVLGALALLAGALALRLLASPLPLFAGTLLAGVAIAIVNVLLPAFIKQEHPRRTGLVMGCYSVGMSAGAAAGAGLTVPLKDALGIGWATALALWAVPVAASAILWLRTPQPAVPPEGSVAPPRIWRQRLAWHVTAFMGLQSFVFYSLLAWLPSDFERHGASQSTAGFLLSVSSVVSLPASFVMPVLAARLREQRLLASLGVGCCVVSVVGLLSAPLAGAYVWMSLLGVGQAVTFAVALSLIVLRTSDTAAAAQLSSMAQSGGYVIAAVGPVLLGAVHELTGGWDVPLVLVLVGLFLQLLSGLGAGRDRRIERGALAPELAVHRPPRTA